MSEKKVNTSAPAPTQAVTDRPTRVFAAMMPLKDICIRWKEQEPPELEERDYEISGARLAQGAHVAARN